MRSFVSSLLLLLLCLTGCARHKSVSQAVAPTLKDFQEIRRNIKTFRDKPDQVTREQRNNIVEELVGIADADYDKKKAALQNGHSTAKFVTETLGTTLSSVSALLGDVDTKSILSTTSSLSQSTLTSAEKNYLADKANDAIVAKMDELRATQLKIIIDHRSDPIDAYGINAALNDAAAYDRAGSLHNALLSISGEAANKKNDAEKQLNQSR